MEQNPPYTAPLNHPTPVVSNGFSSISDLIKKSWLRTQNQLLRLFLLTLIPLVVFITVLLLFGVGIFGVTALGSDNTTLGIGMGVGAAIVLPLIIIFMTALSASVIMIIADTDPSLSPLAVFKKSLKKVWPFLVVSILSGLIVTGGAIILLIPGILFSILLTFASYLVVIDNISPLQAMRKSVYIVSKNFGAIFVRLLVLFLIGFAGSLIISLITGQDGNLTGNILSFVFNLLFGWFSVAFTYSLFQEAKKMAGEGSGKLIWMAVVALIGWLLIGGGGYLIFRSAANNQIPSTITPLQLDNGLLDIDEEILLTPPASVLPASASSSPRTSATPRASATPQASAATSSANR